MDQTYQSKLLKMLKKENFFFQSPQVFELFQHFYFLKIRDPNTRYLDNFTQPYNDLKYENESN